VHYFAQEAAELLKEGIDLITDADAALCNLLSYPLHDTLSRSAKQCSISKFNVSLTLYLAFFLKLPPKLLPKM
jgi:glutamyl-tRNA synthetase